MHTMSKKVLSLFMVIVFCFTMMPTAVFAVDDGETKPIETSTSAPGTREENAEDEINAQEDSALPETEDKEISTPTPLPTTEEKSSKVETETH